MGSSGTFSARSAALLSRSQRLYIMRLVSMMAMLSSVNARDQQLPRASSATRTWNYRLVAAAYLALQCWLIAKGADHLADDLGSCGLRTYVGEYVGV